MVAAHHQAKQSTSSSSSSSRPSVVNLLLGTAFSATLNAATAALADLAGVTVVVAAGN